MLYFRSENIVSSDIFKRKKIILNKLKKKKIGTNFVHVYNKHFQPKISIFACVNIEMKILTSSN